MEQSVEEERRQAEEAAEIARLEAEAAAAAQAEAEAALQAAAGEGAEVVVEGLEGGENALQLVAETGEITTESAETITEANSEPVVVSTDGESPAESPAAESSRTDE
jgi:hypothetical protein